MARERIAPKNEMWSGVVVRPIECANRLGDEAVASGLRILGLVGVNTDLTFMPLRDVTLGPHL
jgi:hypothetical protein